MLVLGLTGGIGAGKSTVATMLRERGANVVDADEIARRVVEPGGLAYQQIVSRFGAGIEKSLSTPESAKRGVQSLEPDTASRQFELDRERLAQIVFADSRARADLESIVHPPVWTEINRLLDSWHSPKDTAEESPVDTLNNTLGFVAVLVLPLLGPSYAASHDRPALDKIAVVDAPEQLCVDRLIARRAMSEGQARARIAAQVSRAERLSIADFVLDNSGDLENLTLNLQKFEAWLVKVKAS